MQNTDRKKKITAGIMAHVDSGKTTLSEALLYVSGNIRKLGRVDHKDAFLDTHILERQRGITIFSKQARLQLEDMEITLLDTPGHADFSAEMERVLPVLDYAILVISGTDGVQAHTETIWQLLDRYRVPTFVFINKMDLSGASKEDRMTQLKKYLSEGCVDFDQVKPLADKAPATPGHILEQIAMCDEDVLEHFLDSGAVEGEQIARLISERKLFPCFFGSALKLDGVGHFLELFDSFTREQVYEEAFAARVFKIARDHQGRRLTYIKVTGGVLRSRMTISYLNRDGEEREEKVNQIRLYSADKFETVDLVDAGGVCAVTGLEETWPGQGIGADRGASSPLLEPVMSYRILLPPDEDVRVVLPKLKLLEEEDPLLHIVWNEHLQQISAELMGQIQIEILHDLIYERFGIDVTIDSGRIMYRETISGPVHGAGHFEPLRHYAEVHLLMEPLETGAGLEFAAACSTDLLDLNWQRLILTHLYEKPHLGVLTGSPIADMRITVIAGRAHNKHTEGGDFRQATYRAVRQGLMEARKSGACVLLEPVYAYRLEVPSDLMGRAINDIRAMHGTFTVPDDYGETLTITGIAPVATMNSYQTELAAYTKGRGRLTCAQAGFRPCHNQDEVIADLAYDPEADLPNTADSVFCSHGSGFNVKWDKVNEYLHIDVGFNTPAPQAGSASADDLAAEAARAARVRSGSLDIDEKELEAIFEREFGPIKNRHYNLPLISRRSYQDPVKLGPLELKTDYIIVDGYNVMFAWEDTKKLIDGGSAAGFDSAREALLERLANFRAYKGCELVVVFDAYRVKGGQGSRVDHKGVKVAFTAEGQTGDAYIEKLADEVGPSYQVRVVTSDGLVQLSAMGAGVLRMSAREFELEVKAAEEVIRDEISEGYGDPHDSSLGNAVKIKNFRNQSKRI